MRFSGNIPKLYAFSFLKMTLFPMAVITLFWKDQIGLSLTDILLLQAIFSVATMLMEYPSGYISDRLGYRFALNLASSIGVLGWIAYTFADSFGGVLFAEILLGFAFAFISGSDSALLFETLRLEDKEESYSRYDGRMTGLAQIGEAVGALFAGVIYAAAPLAPFYLQIGVWLLALLICRTLAEAPKGAEPPSSHLGEAFGTCRHALVESKPLRYTILLAALLGVSSFYPVWLIQPYMQESGVPLAWFGPIWAGANLTVALFSLVSHRISFHLGDRGMILLFFLLIVTGYLGLGLVEGIWGFLFYYLLTAMRGLQGPMLRHQMQMVSTRENRASILSLKSFVFRLLFVVSGPLLGRLADTGGLRPTFLLLSLCLALFLVPLSLLFLRHLSSEKMVK